MEADPDQVDSGTAAWRKTSIAIEEGRGHPYSPAASSTTRALIKLQESSARRSSVKAGSPRPGPARALPGHFPPTRATLREGDLAVVLVRRVGDSALVTSEHAGWTATRSIGIIRGEPLIVRWLRIWLQTPTAKARIDEDVTAHVEPTISLDTLRRMPFPVPPPDVVTAYHRAFSLIEEMTCLYEETARKAVELADALHDHWASSDALRETRPLAKVARATSGNGAERSLPRSPQEPAVGVIAPRDLYDLPVPHIPDFRLSGPADGRERTSAGHHRIEHPFRRRAHRCALPTGGAAQKRRRRTACRGRGRLVAAPRTQKPKRRHR